MANASTWELTPRQSIERECARRGREAVVDGCIALLQNGDDEVDGGLILALGGPPARRILSGDSRADGILWTRVWALRGLLWAWEERASPALAAALADPSWRVREMALKVVRRHLVGDHLAAVADLRDDPTPRVRAVAADALRRLAGARG